MKTETESTLTQSAEFAKLQLCQDKARELCRAIEDLSASTWQTNLSIAASNVSGTIQEKLHPDLYKS